MSVLHCIRKIIHRLPTLRLHEYAITTHAESDCPVYRNTSHICDNMKRTPDFEFTSRIPPDFEEIVVSTKSRFVAVKAGLNIMATHNTSSPVAIVYHRRTDCKHRDKQCGMQDGTPDKNHSRPSGSSLKPFYGVSFFPGGHNEYKFLPSSAAF